MAQVILLGTGSAWSGPERENTFLLVRGNGHDRLIYLRADVGEVVQRYLAHRAPYQRTIAVSRSSQPSAIALAASVSVGTGSERSSTDT